MFLPRTFTRTLCRTLNHQRHFKLNISSVRSFSSSSESLVFKNEFGESVEENRKKSFRQLIKAAPILPNIIKEIESLRIGRTRDKRKKSDRMYQIAARKDELVKEMDLRPNLVVSASTPDDFPLEKSTFGEVVFAGRSNVGKSSLLNVLTGRRIAARVSQKPGETKAIDFYRLSNKKMRNQSSAALPRMVDLPGYGFAYASDATIEGWKSLIHTYLEQRKSIEMLCIIVDARHGLKKTDLDMIEKVENSKTKLLVVLNKSDLVEQVRILSLS
eukprot:g1050.t1